MGGILSPGNALEMQILQRAPARVRLTSEQRCSKQVLGVLLVDSDFKTPAPSRTCNSLPNPGELRRAGGSEYGDATLCTVGFGVPGNMRMAVQCAVLGSSPTSSQVQAAPPFCR